MKKFKSALYLILIIVTLLDILLLVYVAFYPTSSAVKYNVLAFDLILCVVLWIEFIYGYYKSDKKQYMKDNAFSILGMLPVDFVFLRALRLIKLLQLIRFFAIENYEKPISKFLRETFLDKIIAVAIISIFVLTVLIRVVDPYTNNINTALWYIIVSMTSTGYGDIVPVTTSGRIIGAAAMIGGILIFATVTAVISSQYVSKIHKNHNDDMELKIEKLTSEVEKLNKKIDELKKE